MIYLAAPYSHPDEDIRIARYNEISSMTVKIMMEDGDHVFSPITYAHPLAVKFGLSGGWDFWQSFDMEFIRRCDAVAVYMLKGWRESVGVNAEIQFAKEIGKPIWYLSHLGHRFSYDPGDEHILELYA